VKFETRDDATGCILLAVGDVYKIKLGGF